MAMNLDQNYQFFNPQNVTGARVNSQGGGGGNMMMQSARPMTLQPPARRIGMLSQAPPVGQIGVNPYVGNPGTPTIPDQVSRFAPSQMQGMPQPQPQPQPTPFVGPQNQIGLLQQALAPPPGVFGRQYAELIGA